MLKKLLLRGAEKLITRSLLTPYDHLDGYMERYWVVPNRRKSVGKGCGPVAFKERPIAWVLQKFDIAIRAHRVLRSDNDRAFHDHPWHFVSMIVDGSYVEVTPIIDESGIYVGEKRVRYEQGDILFRRAKQLHRLELEINTPQEVQTWFDRNAYRHKVKIVGVTFKPVWTLFISGPKLQRWGFFPNIEKQKIYYRDYNPEEDNV